MSLLAWSLVLAVPAALTPAREAPADVDRVPVPSRRHAWPVVGPVVRPFEPPLGPFGAGHRGIDIAVPVGTSVRASEAGSVAFAGTIAGERFVSIDHAGGVRTSYSWLSGIAVRRGDRVGRGSPVGTTSAGHPGEARPHLHFGVRIAGAYVDPLLVLERRTLVGLVHLAPLEAGDRRL